MTAGDVFNGIAIEGLVRELRARGCIVCVFVAEDVAPLMSGDEAVRCGDEMPSDKDLDQAAAFIRKYGDDVEQAMTTSGFDAIETLSR